MEDIIRDYFLMQGEISPSSVMQIVEKQDKTPLERLFLLVVSTGFDLKELVNFQDTFAYRDMRTQIDSCQRMYDLANAGLIEANKRIAELEERVKFYEEHQLFPNEK